MTRGSAERPARRTERIPLAVAGAFGAGFAGFLGLWKEASPEVVAFLRQVA